MEDLNIVSAGSDETKNAPMTVTPPGIILRACFECSNIQSTSMVSREVAAIRITVVSHVPNFL